MWSQLRRPSIPVAALILLLASSYLAAWDMQQADNGAGAAERRQKLVERDEHSTQAVQLRAEGKLSEAIAELERAWEIEVSIYGSTGQPATILGERLVRWRLENDADASAAALVAQIQDGLRKQSPISQWQLKYFSGISDQVKTVRGWNPDQRKKFRDSGKLTAEVLMAMRVQQLDDALATAARLQAIRIELWGDKHVENGLSLYSRGSLLSMKGRFAESDTLLKEALQIWRQNLGLEHPLCARALAELANSSLGQGRLQEAITHASQAQELFERTLGKENGEYASSLRFVAKLKFANNEVSEAEKLFRRLYPLVARLSGSDSAEAARVELEWGYCLVVLGNHEEGRKLLDSAKPKLEKANDWDQYVTCLMRLVESHDATQDFRRAIESIDEILVVRRRISGVDNKPYISYLQLKAAFRTQSGDLPGAQQDYEQARDLASRVLGKTDFIYGTIVSGLGNVLHQRRLFVESKNALQEALSICEQQKNGNQLYTANVRLSLASTLIELGKQGEALRLLGKNEELGRANLDDSSWHSMRKHNLRTVLLAHLSVGDHRASVNVSQELLKHHARTDGLKTLDAATDFESLGNGYLAIGNPSRAVEPTESAAEIYRTKSGPDSPEYARALCHRAKVLIELEDYDKSFALLKQSDAILMKAGEKGVVQRAELLQIYSSFYDSMGDVARAESSMEESLALLMRSVGEKNVRTLGALDVITAVYKSHGQFEKAEKTALRLVELQKEMDGQESQSTALAIASLVSVYIALQKSDEALVLERRVGEILEKTAGRDSWHYANHLAHLGSIYDQQKNPLAAIQTFEETARLYQKIGVQSLVGSRLSSAGWSAVSAGDWDKAEALFREAADLEAARCGRQHTAYLLPLRSLALVLYSQGRTEKAELLQREVLNAHRQLLRNASVTLSERQQLDLTRELRGALDFYLALNARPPADESPSIEHVYDYVLAAKGTVFIRQRLLSATRRDPQLLPLVRRVEASAVKLSALHLTDVGLLSPAERDAEARRFSEESEQLEAELAQKSPAFRRERNALALTLKQLQPSLPVGGVLVDFLEYDFPLIKSGGALRSERRLTAFLVRRHGPAQRVELGLVETIARIRDTWKPESRTRLTPQRLQAAQELRALVWSPIEKLLSREDKLVLCSPDGVTATIPFAALPGDAENSYLLDNLLFATIPVPQLLPALVEKSRPVQAVSADKLLLVGDVDYDTSNDAAADPVTNEIPSKQFVQAAAIPRSNPKFEPLSGTKQEIEAIERRWPLRDERASVDKLSGKVATEAAFRRQAPEAAFLHLATHGFFDNQQSAKPDRRNAAASLFVTFPSFRQQATFAPTSSTAPHPGLLSGLVLAGANHRASGKTVASPENDGWLTALDVPTMHLDRTRLAVLSACETAQGETASGEGVLGLQRAFQTAGTDSVVATLWKIPDIATSRLMDRFYENLWTKGLGRAAALREAQQWLKQEAVRDPEILRTGVQLLDDERPNPNEPLPPFWWGAFVISGDWR